MLKGARQAVGITLVLAGALLLLAALAGYAEGPVWQLLNGREEAPRDASHRSVPPGEPFARLRIPKIGLDVMVVEGTGREELLKGPGHLIGSAAPGATDNCVLAGHRDLHFRGLGRLRLGDAIQIEAEGWRLEYRVEGRRVIDPSDRAVMASTDVPVLTLLTCYPFRHIGPAPRRYVVRARLERAIRVATASREGGALSPAESTWGSIVTRLHQGNISGTCPFGGMPRISGWRWAAGFTDLKGWISPSAPPSTRITDPS